MSHSPAAVRRKPSRLGLYGPYLLLGAAVAAWSAYWLWLAGGAGQRIDAGAKALRAAGWTVVWSQRHIGGYPFRLDVDFQGVGLAAPSGWGVQLPDLKTEAPAYLPGHWILAAPDGLTLYRPREGPVRVDAKLLRASVSGLDRQPPRIAVEGRNLIFSTPPSAQPFFASSIGSLQFNTEPGPDDQAALFLQAGQVQAAFTGLVGRVAGGKPMDIDAEAIASHASAAAGRDWPEVVGRWRAAGGRLSLPKLTFRAGSAALNADAAVLGVGDDGRLDGTLSAVLTQISAASPAAPPQAQARIDLRGGKAFLGSVPIGPAPRVY